MQILFFFGGGGGGLSFDGAGNSPPSSFTWRMKMDTNLWVSEEHRLSSEWSCHLSRRLVFWNLGVSLGDGNNVLCLQEGPQVCPIDFPLKPYYSSKVDLHVLNGLQKKKGLNKTQIAGMCKNKSSRGGGGGGGGVSSTKINSDFKAEWTVLSNQF